MRKRAKRVASALTSLVIVLAGGHGARAAGNERCFDAAEEGQLLRYRGDLVSARAKLIACSADACPSAVRHDCVEWLSQIDAVMPSVAIHATDARGHDVISARVYLDEKLVADRLGGTAIQANPGAHTVRLETPSGARFQEQILLAEGQKERLLEAVFQVALDPDGMPARAMLAPPTLSKGEGPGTGRVVAAVGLGTLGVAALVAATYFEVSGQSEYHDLVSGCGTEHSCSQDAIDTSKQKLYVLAPASLGVGVLAIGGAALVWWLGRGEPVASSGAWSVDVVGTTGLGASGVLTRRF
jgi:hypothetical protein